MGSSWVRSVVDPGSQIPIYLSEIAAIEVPAALCRKERRGEITQPQLYYAIAWFRFHLGEQYFVIPWGAALLEEAGRLVETYPLRSLDALQVASALACDAAYRAVSGDRAVFVTCDRQVLQCADEEGLLVENPEDYGP